VIVTQKSLSLLQREVVKRM